MTSHGRGQIDDDLLRRAVEARNPVRGSDLPPFTLTPAEMRAQADLRTAAKVPSNEIVVQRLTRRKFLGGAVATIGAGAAAYLLWPSAAIASPGHLDIDYTEPARSAADWLTNLADSLKSESSGADSGRNTTYVHLQRWSMNTIDPASELIAQDIRIWWKSDLSGRELLTTLPSQPSGESTALYLEQVPPGTPQSPIEYVPGEFSSLIDVPSTNPEQLKSQLDTHEPPSNGPQATLRAIADVTAIHHLSSAQKRAFLIVLAGIPGLIWRGTTKDRAGRACNALSTDSGDASKGLRRDLLLVSMTGEIYGHEAIALTAPPRSRISNNTVIEYTLHLQKQHLPG